MDDRKKYYNIKRVLLFSVCCCLFIFIFLTWFLGYRLGCSLPFAPYYHSFLELPLAIALLIYCISTSFLLIIDKNGFRQKAIAYQSPIITILGSITYLIYHFFYDGTPQITVWKDAENVTPYHVQLGAVFFTNVIAVNFILMFSKALNIWIRIMALLFAVAGLLFSL